jgi:hypothetical protein
MSCLIGGITLEQLITFEYLLAIGSCKKGLPCTHVEHFSLIRIPPSSSVSGQAEFAIRTVNCSTLRTVHLKILCLLFPTPFEIFQFGAIRFSQVW